MYLLLAFPSGTIALSTADGALRHAGAEGLGVDAQVREHLPVPDPA